MSSAASDENDSVLITDECPKCAYPPQPDENVHWYELEGEYGTGFAVDCPHCGNRYMFAYKGKDGIELPPREEIVNALREVHEL
jgi:ribosomal protein S27AE